LLVQYGFFKAEIKPFPSAPVNRSEEGLKAKAVGRTVTSSMHRKILPGNGQPERL
jgi:hypothetical protein